MNGSQIARIKRENAPITLESGEQLQEQQANAVYLKVLSDLSNEKIATATGYNSGAELTEFLHSQKGQEALKQITFNTLFDNAIMALRSQAALARSARSEQVRHLAAKCIMEMANLKVQPDGPVHQRTGGTVNIQINAGDAHTRTDAGETCATVHTRTDGEKPIKLADTTPQTGRVGEK